MDTTELTTPFKLAKKFDVHDRIVILALEQSGLKPAHTYSAGKNTMRFYMRDKAETAVATYLEAQKARKPNTMAPASQQDDPKLDTVLRQLQGILDRSASACAQKATEMHKTDDRTDAAGAPVERPVRPGPEAHKLTDRQIADMAFAVLREHNDNRLWRALTYDSGPYDVTTPTLALCHLARVFFAAGVAAALAGCMDMVQPPDIAIAEELCAKRGGYAHAQRWERGAVLDINCKDGTQMQVRPPKKA